MSGDLDVQRRNRDREEDAIAWRVQASQPSDQRNYVQLNYPVEIDSIMSTQGRKLSVTWLSVDPKAKANLTRPVACQGQDKYMTNHVLQQRHLLDEQHVRLGAFASHLRTQITYRSPLHGPVE